MPPPQASPLVYTPKAARNRKTGVPLLVEGSADASTLGVLVKKQGNHGQGPKKTPPKVAGTGQPFKVLHPVCTEVSAEAGCGAASCRLP